MDCRKAFLQAIARQQPATAKDTLALLQQQPAQYIVAQLFTRKYLLTPNDVLTVPRIRNLKVGDKIQLDRILELGSRSYSLTPSSSASSQAYLDAQTITAQAQVVEHTKSALVTTEKFKRRKRYHRTIISKPEFTKLRILDFVVGGQLMGQSHIAQRAAVHVQQSPVANTSET